MEIFLILMASSGLTQILMYGTILNVPRNYIKRCNFFKELLNCSLCTGFWTGMLFSSINYYFNQNLYHSILLPFACSGASFMYDHILESLLKYAPKE